MGCTPFQIGDVSGFVCTRGRAAPCQSVGCNDPHVALCDYPVTRDGQPGTCDRRMCRRHRHPVPGEHDKDYCDAHHRLAGQSKAGYVRSEAAKGHDGKHRCHAEGCTIAVAPAFLMCGKHWRMVPIAEQRAIWRHFKPGQEKTKTPSQEYLLALRAAVEAVAQKEGRR